MVNLLYVSEQENVDPLEHVIAANQTNIEEPQTSPRQENPPHRVLHERQQNTGSLFAREPPSQHDTTANLLSNAQRLEQYSEIPNVFLEAQQNGNHNTESVVLDSYRTEESSQSADRLNIRPSNEVNHSNVFADIPPHQRLFSTSGADLQSQNAHAGSHFMFDPTQTVVAGSSVHRGHNSRNNVYKGRPKNSISSAPPAVEGGLYTC